MNEDELLQKITEAVAQCGEIIINADRTQAGLVENCLPFFRRRFLWARRKIYTLPLKKDMLLL